MKKYATSFIDTGRTFGLQPGLYVTHRTDAVGDCGLRY